MSLLPKGQKIFLDVLSHEGTLQETLIVSFYLETW